MNYSKLQLWERFKKYYREYPTIGLALDLSRMRFEDDFFAQMDPRIQKAFDEMDALEAGAVANPDEDRRVGHYWLRNPALAPTGSIRKEIEDTVTRIETFAREVHAGVIHGQGGAFKNLLLIGIGGSALGPQFVANALGYPRRDKLTPYFIDNTDPDGIQRVFATIGDNLGRTLCLVVSKSGGTKETRNGMLEAKAVYEASGFDFGRHCVAITREGSLLHEVALKDKWLTSFPMWDWVGGRTSELSAVGLLPAALQGIEIKLLLSGAKACDDLTRSRYLLMNPSAQLALAWYFSGDGMGSKDMVVIPYKDRLELLSRYLQQLVMESLGKSTTRDGIVVNQGISVFGNKGSTDQHAYIQQLRDGLGNFFVTFLEVLSDGESSNLMVDPNTTSADYLAGFYLGTRQALFDNGRDSITVTAQEVSPRTIGALIALFERAVGFYATLININAYHQPGVEAGKKAAESVLILQTAIFDCLSESRGVAMTCAEIASRIGKPEEVELVFKICERLSVNPRTGISRRAALDSFSATYRIN